MRTIRDLTLWISLTIAVCRLFIIPRLDLPTATGSYEAVAHMWVGGLFGAAIAYGLSSRETANRPEFSPSVSQRFLVKSKFCWMTGLAISLVELFMFIYQKFMK